MITDSDLETGARLAEAATPGEWAGDWCGHGWPGEPIYYPVYVKGIMTGSPSPGNGLIAEVVAATALSTDEGAMNAAFIAWANPARVRELIEEVRQLRHEAEIGRVRGRGLLWHMANHDGPEQFAWALALFFRAGNAD